jgi:hypothetical protein
MDESRDAGRIADTRVIIADVPGCAVVVTRVFYESLQAGSSK